MSDRGRRAGGIAELPLINQDKFGLHVTGGTWTLYTKTTHHGASCDRLESTIYLGDVTARHDGATTGWTINIVKPRGSKGELRQGWYAEVERDGVYTRVLVGISRGWRECVDHVQMNADLPTAMAKTGANIYGRGGADWFVLRPFKVVWPWSHPGEPNARYSEFRMVSTLHVESMGEYVAVYKGSPNTYASRGVVEKLGGNALLERLTDAHGNESWQVWHRDSMRESDPIDIDDWCARMIAGAGEAD